jgi:endonuclease YncB( thermonuclease family)
MRKALRIRSPFLIALVVLISIFFAISASANDLIIAKVVGVADGESITVLSPGSKPVKIRLHGIDYPEKGQAFGKRAKQYTSNQCFGKTIAYRPVDIDRYGRTVAMVFLPDGNELNLEILIAGYAWHYKRYSNRQDYADAEQQAHQNKVGLWADPQAKPPWEWRRDRRQKS